MGSTRALQLYLVYCGVSSFLFAVAYTVAAVYRVQTVELNPLQLVLVGTTLEVTYFAFNVPTGVVADTYSRRLSVIAGVLLWGLGLLVEGAFPLFVAVLLAQVIGGIGYTLVEGAIEAWLTDEIGEERVGSVLLRGGQIGRAAAFVGIGASVGLASVRLNLPLLVAGALFVAFSVYLTATMRETPLRRSTGVAGVAAVGWRARLRGPLQEMGSTARLGAATMRRRPLALTVLAVAAIFGGFTEGFDRLWEAHVLTVIGLPGLGAFEPVVWFGIIAAGAMLLGIGAAEVMRRRLDLGQSASAVRALFGLEATLMAAVIVFALAGSFAVAVGAYMVASMSRSLVYPVYTAWINRGLDPQARATILSMSGQSDALGQFTVGPALGALGSGFGLRVALTVAGLALAPAVLLYGRAMGKLGATPDAATETA